MSKVLIDKDLKDINLDDIKRICVDVDSCNLCPLYVYGVHTCMSKYKDLKNTLNVRVKYYVNIKE